MSEPRKLAIGKNGGALLTPWVKGQSGNPSGLARDGGPAKTYPLRSELRRQLGTIPRARKFVKRLIELAEEGNTAALNGILARLDPIIEESGASGKTVFEGIRLEVAKGKVSLSMHSTTECSSESARSSLPLAVELDDSNSDALIDTSESQEESSTVDGSDVPLLESSQESPRSAEYEVKESVTVVSSPPTEGSESP